MWIVIKYFLFRILLVVSLFSGRFCLANEYADIGLPITQVYGINEHGGGTQSWWLTQTDDGLIYVGTNRGLNQWDGEQWHFFPTPGKTRIRSIGKWTDDRLYVGTQNDIGYYQTDERGFLTYHSLIPDWAFEQRQFGEVWSVAANKQGVMFAASKALLFWDGKHVRVVDHEHPSIPRIFALEDRFVFKPSDNAFLYEVQFESNGSSQIPLVVKTDLSLPEKTLVRNIFLNARQQLVVFTSTRGIYLLNNAVLEQRVARQALGVETKIYDAIQARDGYYYVATTHHGVFILNENLQPVRQYTKDHNLGSQRLYHVMEDQQGNIWLSGRLNIIKMYPPHIYSAYQTDTPSTGSENIGLLRNRVTIAGDSVFQLAYPEQPLAPAFFKNIKSKTEFSWHFIEYRKHLFYSISDGVYVAKITNDSEHNAPVELSSPRHLISSAAGRTFAIDPLSNLLFAATNDGLYRIEYEIEKSDWHIQLITGTQDELDRMVIDRDGIIWAGTATQELYRIEDAQYPDRVVNVKKFTAEDGLASNNVIPFNLSDGVVIGTDDGLMDYQAGRQPELDFVQDLPEIFTRKGHDVFRLYEDRMGHIWYRIGQYSGYIAKDKQGQWQTTEDILSPFKNDNFKGFVATADNSIWFTLATGAVFRLDLQRLVALPEEGKLNIRQVSLITDGTAVYGGLNRPFLPELDHKRNAIRIHYALADNTIDNATQYRHRLLGSDNPEWTAWSDEIYKDFTQLHGAEYQFQLQSLDGWGRSQSATLSFSVLPPWYLSSLAWFTYFVFALLLLFITSWLTQRWRTAKLLEDNVKLERQVAVRTKEVQEKATQLQHQQTLKDRFFANVSHEFRTPLTLTIEPLNELLRTRVDLGQDIVLPVETALRNSKKMLGLVGQVLDINRLESGHFPLHVAQYNIADLINQIVSQYSHWAEQHQQSITTLHTEDPFMLYYDQDQIEKCISNLVSNAIKYGGENCQISVSLLANHGIKARTKFLAIEVIDTGPGIAVDDQNKVFERFYQGEQSEKITEPGTGIGLALVKELIELHQGEIELVSSPEPGCRFRLWLRLGCDHFEPAQLIDAEPNLTSEPINLIPVQQIIDGAALSSDTQESDVTTVLVVDDNAELRQFISHRLTGYYHVIQATNGKEGLALAKSSLPDLIISDVMMPLMNGLEMTKQIKAHGDTCTIPIILLTAKSTKRETVEGIQSGADDYLSKPFDTSELIVRTARLISAQKMLRKVITEEITQANALALNSGKASHSFEQKIRSEILSQLSNPEFNIEQLCEAFSMSRSSMNRKCQQTLNTSVGQYIIELRMQTAVALLKEGNHNVSEIAYGTGHESLAYFSRVFKKHFGQSPSAFRK